MSDAFTDLRISEVHALCELGAAILVVRGQLVIRQGRRLSDHANHPDPMLELDAAASRVLGAQSTAWVPARNLSVNRDRVAVLVPYDEADPGADPLLLAPTRDVHVRLTTPAAVVEGLVKVPVAATIAAYIHETRHRYLAVTEASIEDAPLGPALGELAGRRPFCLVNRASIVACAELA